MIESRTFLHDRLAGILVPVFALRRDDDLGIGDTTAVRELVDWASELGFQFLQFLPINEPCGDNSPYNAVSSIALDPLTIDTSPAAIPELTESAYREELQEVSLQGLRQGPVNYPQVKALKRNLLRRAFEGFRLNHFGKKTERERQFLRFCSEEHAWLYDYCVFRLLMDRSPSRENWEEWPDEYNSISKARATVDQWLLRDKEETELLLASYAYVQFLAFEQWDQVSAYAAARRVKLMGDIPFGVSRCSVDVFAHPELFDLEWCGGAPPETTFKDDEFVIRFGQNWGIPLYRWDVMARDDYAWWRQRVAKLARFFQIFRIDHALGFYRIYSFPWRPERNREFLSLSHDELLARTNGRHPGFNPGPDDTEELRARNRALGEQYLRAIRDAAGESSIVAEDLGTVPPYVPESLLSIGLAGMRVPMWVSDEHGEFRRGTSYPQLTLATYATHDHEPLKTQWEKQRRIALSSHDPGAAWHARLFLERLGRFADIDGFDHGQIPDYTDHLRECLLDALFQTNSRYASVMITDLLGLEDRFNVPGVLSESNWSQRLPVTLRELREQPAWVTLGGRIRNHLKDSGRFPRPA